MRVETSTLWTRRVTGHGPCSTATAAHTQGRRKWRSDIEILVGTQYRPAEGRSERSAGVDIGWRKVGEEGRKHWGEAGNGMRSAAKMEGLRRVRGSRAEEADTAQLARVGRLGGGGGRERITAAAGVDTIGRPTAWTWGTWGWALGHGRRLRGAGIIVVELVFTSAHDSGVRERREAAGRGDMGVCVEREVWCGDAAQRACWVRAGASERGVVVFVAVWEEACGAVMPALMRRLYSAMSCRARRLVGGVRGAGNRHRVPGQWESEISSSELVAQRVPADSTGNGRNIWLVTDAVDSSPRAGRVKCAAKQKKDSTLHLLLPRFFSKFAWTCNSAGGISPDELRGKRTIGEGGKSTTSEFGKYDWATEGMLWNWGLGPVDVFRGNLSVLVGLQLNLNGWEINIVAWHELDEGHPSWKYILKQASTLCRHNVKEFT
ncbi:hypothetical protein B0H16DRAFT_1808039 [Mycena metata]|uniref:Uncharacterized protein n=1 Tax=Mycena metata TaxID=1033252 RepID=A0AAD7H836_9AGAR|nr:hypothetical protein B0H16DRAFT_1808039 [Mycena metata]